MITLKILNTYNIFDKLKYSFKIVTTYVMYWRSI